MKARPSTPDDGSDEVTDIDASPRPPDRAVLTVVPPVVSARPRPLEGPARETGAGHRGRGHALEVSLVVAARSGDLEAYECLLRTHRDDLVRLGVWLLTDSAAAQDAVQHTLALAWRRLPTLREPRHFRAWLYQTMTRRCLQMLRNGEDADVAVVPRGIRLGGPPGASTEPARLAAIDTTLSSALHELPRDQREVWVLRELQHQSYVEIARSTGCSVSTVRGRLARARRRVPAALAAWR